MDKKKLSTALIIFLVLAILILSAYLAVRMIASKEKENNYKNIANTYASGLTDTVEDTTEDVKSNPSVGNKNSTGALTDNPVSFQELAAANPEIYAWIYIPNTNINYPVCQSRVDDNFYLSHDIYKNYSFPGAIYTQICNKTDFSDRVTVLYGHNMADGSMFANLHRYENTEFFNSNKYFYIYTKNHKLTYEVVSAFDYDDRHIMNSFDFSDDEVFQSWLDDAKNPHSIYRNVNSSVELNLDSKLVVLSTCLDSGEGRYLVQGVQIKDEQTQ